MTALLDRVRAPLFIDRYCLFCGRAFRAKNANARFCSKGCQMKQWRAIKMLEGTHSWDAGQHRFVRLPVPA